MRVAVVLGVVVAVTVAVTVCVRVAERVGVFVRVYVDVRVDVLVRVFVRVRVLVRVRVSVRVSDAVRVRVSVRVSDAVKVFVGVTVNDGVNVTDGVNDNIGVWVAMASVFCGISTNIMPITRITPHNNRNDHPPSPLYLTQYTKDYGMCPIVPGDTPPQHAYASLLRRRYKTRPNYKTTPHRDKLARGPFFGGRRLPQNVRVEMLRHALPHYAT